MFILKLWWCSRLFKVLVWLVVVLLCLLWIFRMICWILVSVVLLRLSSIFIFVCCMLIFSRLICFRFSLLIIWLRWCRW